MTQFYMNGILRVSQSNVNLKGCHATAGGWNAEVGGVDTVIWPFNASGQCIGGSASAIPTGGGRARANPFSAAPVLEADGVSPCLAQTIFIQYIEDIIILEK